MNAQSQMFQMFSMAKDLRKLAKENLESQLVDVMNHLNVSVISFVPNGNNSNYDVPRAYATTEDDSTLSDEPFYTREIIAVALLNNHIYIVRDTDNVNDKLLDELDLNTHFTKRDLAILRKLGLGKVAERITDNYNLLHPTDTMFQVFNSCYEALIPIQEPLTQTINISE